MATPEQVEIVKTYLARYFSGSIDVSSTETEQRFRVAEEGGSYEIAIHRELFDEFEPDTIVIQLEEFRVAERLRAAGPDSLALVEGIGKVIIQPPPTW